MEKNIFLFRQLLIDGGLIDVRVGLPVSARSFYWMEKFTIIVRPHLWGEELYTQMGFFVQSILVHRYIHRKEMWVVSLKSSSSVELETKKIFFNFVFFEELSRIEVLCEQRDVWLDFVTF